MRLYKAQVLSYVESRTPAIYHATRTTLDEIDRIQRRFLRSIGVTELEALTESRLAPLSARRAMTMPGLLHKVSNGFAPRSVAALFLCGSTRQEDPHMRVSEIRHGRQLAEFGAMEATLTFSNDHALVLWRSGTGYRATLLTLQRQSSANEPCRTL